MAEKVINGTVYKIDQPLASTVLVLQARLAGIAGPLVEKLPKIMAVAAGTTSEAEKAAANAELISAVTDIFKTVSPSDWMSLVKDIVELGKIKRQSGAYDPIDLDGDFTGSLSNLIPVLVFFLKEVFGDFFTGLRGVGSHLKEKAG